jgi:mannose/fructose/N-acetylgalactosamine-specific phosphotransferase system component IIC
MATMALLVSAAIAALLLWVIMTFLESVFVWREQAQEIVVDAGYVWWVRLIALPLWATLACICFFLTLLAAWGLANMVKDGYQWLNSKK